MSHLVLECLGKTYGGTAVVREMSLAVAEGELVVLLGPSGCGKTTTLRMIAGFIAATCGDIRLDGRSILSLPPHKRDMGLVFQSYALFPHLPVARNVAFGLEMRGAKPAAREARVAEMLRLTRLDHLADRLPRQLSGGQQQRVALARALAIRPRLLLLDEPLSNLDAALRAEVGRDIKLLQRESALSTIMVTHDQDEAMAMADRLVVMKEGRVEQVGSQEDLYERPATAFVASFIGRSTMLPGMLAEPGLFMAGEQPIRLAGRYAGQGVCSLALRPERLRLGAADGGGNASGAVELASYLGPMREHVLRIGPQLRLIVREATAGGGQLAAAGDRVSLHWDAGAERVFDGGGVPVPSLQPAIQATRIISHA